MRAMVLEGPGLPLRWSEVPKPEPSPGQLLIRVHACGVCRTDLHVLDAELPHIAYPIIPGHEVVGRVVANGPGALEFQVGQRVGVPWLGHTCQHCSYCLRGAENLCEQAGFTGYTLNGGYAEYLVADSRYCFPIPDRYGDEEAAPLLCAGLIGYRALRACGEAVRLGIYGFGAAAHIVAQVAVAQGRTVYAFTRPGDSAAQSLALQLGACWADSSDNTSPVPLDAAIIFAPVGELVPLALGATDKGGVVVCAGIHMSDIPSFPYALLWDERRICSIANLTRQDGLEFFSLAERLPLQIQVTRFPLAEANEALAALRHGRFTGAAVLTMP